MVLWRLLLIMESFQRRFLNRKVIWWAAFKKTSDTLFKEARSPNSKIITPWLKREHVHRDCTHAVPIQNISDEAVAHNDHMIELALQFALDLSSVASGLAGGMPQDT